MALVQSRAVYVFAHLAGEFVPAGKLELVEQGSELLASNFAYGQRYLGRANALEIDPVSLGLRQRDDVRGKRLVPANGLKFFGGIRDAAPDAWGSDANGLGADDFESGDQRAARHGCHPYWQRRGPASRGFHLG